MSKILFINAYSNWGSTGRIVEQIGVMAQKKGWDCYVAYGRKMNPSNLKVIRIGYMANVYEHYLEHRLFDNEGLASRKPTKKLIQIIDSLKPDMIHLHNIHDHWLNYEILFKYLSAIDIPIVWTQHDCWGFTGGCPYFSINHCQKWKVGCCNCIQNKGFLPLTDKSKVHFEKKKDLLLKLQNLTIVPVSLWLCNLLKQSFLNAKSIVPIYNGVDTDVFKPIDNNDVKNLYGIGDKKLLVAAATTWSERKGLRDYIQLAGMLPDDIRLMLIGLNDVQMKGLPSNIIGLKRTQNIEEMVSLYSAADIVLNLSYEETFGLTTVEGFACGTPGIVYNATASPELITPETGIIVKTGDIEGVAKAINDILLKGKAHYAMACRQRAVHEFNKEDRFNDYIKLYEELVHNH